MHYNIEELTTFLQEPAPNKQDKDSKEEQNSKVDRDKVDRNNREEDRKYIPVNLDSYQSIDYI